MACTQADVLINTEILPNPKQHPPQNTLGELHAKVPLMGNLKVVPAPGRILCYRQAAITFQS